MPDYCLFLVRWSVFPPAAVADTLTRSCNVQITAAHEILSRSYSSDCPPLTAPLVEMAGIDM